jgi:hypothetical protein
MQTFPAHVGREHVYPIMSEKVQKVKQRSTKHTHKAKDLVTRTPSKTGGELQNGKQFLLH